MKFHYLVLCLFILPLGVHSQEWKNFTDTSISFTAKYPANWVNKIKEGKRVFFTSPGDNSNDNFYENVNISMTKNESFGKTIAIKETIPSVLEEIRPMLDDFSLTSERYFKWNNSDACEIIYTGRPKDSDLEIKIVQWFCFSKQRLFTATYTALATDKKHTATAMAILRSIRFR